jgi:hypothetical protein
VVAGETEVYANDGRGSHRLNLGKPK